MKKPGHMMKIIVVIFFSCLFFTFTTIASSKGYECVECHSKPDNMPGLFKQYTKSKHSTEGVTCIECHGAKRDEPDAFEHYDEYISIIVSPLDCGRCHEKALNEFQASQHANARELITTGLGGYFLNSPDLLANRYKVGKYAAGVNGCFRCHGSEIKLDKHGYPTVDTWPNSGIGRKNPDESLGNCAACHERHEFSLAQARHPAACAICHNELGGDPQIEAYNTSRHGTSFYAQQGQMNLAADNWVVGEDYYAAPTCATCHMGGAPGISSTHNINLRLNWNELLQKNNSVALQEKCGLPESIGDVYVQPKPDKEHRRNMKQVCTACHSEKLFNYYVAQYEAEVQLVREKWLKPGKELYRLATKLLQARANYKKEPYTPFTNPIDYTWLGICNLNTKQAHTGASMVSPGMVQEGNGNIVASWYSSYIPQLCGFVNENIEASNPGVKNAAEALSEKLKEVMKDDKACFDPRE